MAKKFPIKPLNPERICWGCDKYCPSDSLACGNGSDRTQHPIEFFGSDWESWGLDAKQEPVSTSTKDKSLNAEDQQVGEDFFLSKDGPNTTPD